jgi:DNA polymerase III subunit alpha
MLHLIEPYDDSEAMITVEGRSFPAICLVEDDQGLRWFLTKNAELIDVHTWMRASSSGASALLTQYAGVYAAMTVEVFMEQRTETIIGYAIPKQWAAFTSLPTYPDLMSATDFGPAFAAKKPEQRRGLVHLHNHSELSMLDGMSKASEIVEVVVAQGGFAVGVADHGNCAVHPYLQEECDKAGIKPIFGMEAYFVDDRLPRLSDYDQNLIREYADQPQQTLTKAQQKIQDDEAKAVRSLHLKGLQDYYHLVLFAIDERGLHNLWAMSTESFKDGFYGKPRLDWETLARYSEGVIATSACLRGPLTHHGLLEGNQEAARARLGRLLEIFQDRFYIEIHCNQLPEQIKVNNELVVLAREFKVPLLASVDSHYPKIEDREAHRVWLSMQTSSDIADESTLFAGGQDYHIKDEAEVRVDLAYLGQAVVDEAIANTVVIADMCTARMFGTSKPPIFSAKGGADADVERLMELCMSNWHKTIGKREPQSVYFARFEHEFPLLVRKGFCGYYLMTAEGTGWAKGEGILVGPGRGSGSGSLVAYLAAITDIDPVDADLIFERFMTEGRTSLPDFDVDYPATKKGIVQQHARDRYGDDHVVVVGSILRLKNKGIIKKLGSAMKSTLPDSWFMDSLKIAKVIDDAEGDTAGLGLSWDELWAKAGVELDEYRIQYPHLFEMADRLVGRSNTFGQHASGMIITTDTALTEQLPMRRADEDGHMIAQFDKDVLEQLGFVKFDLLTIKNLDIIQHCVDLIKERRGHTVDVYSWREEYTDPQVWEEIANAHTLGIFQIETQLGTQYAKRMQPRSMADLSDLVTIVRPGPRNSGLTETYLKRRAGLEDVTYPDPRLEKVLAKTYGALLYQEQIMQTTMVLGGYDSNEADEVRKILGHKQIERVAAAGQEFIARATAGGMRANDVAALWSQMAEFAKYSFGGAHAYSYAVLGFWEAWLKFHYPVEFLTAALSGVDKTRIPEFIKEARRMGFSVLPPDINESGSGFRAGSLSMRYGLDSIKGIGMAALAIAAAQPFTSFDDFMARTVEPKGSKVNRGHVALLARIGAFDSLVSNRRGLEQILLSDKTGESTQCVNKDIDVSAVNGLPCVFDWLTEEAPVNPRTGKKMKIKPIPKRCTKACRQYVAPPPQQMDEVTPYTDVDIRNIEQELLGVFLSSTPFDMLPDETRNMTRAQAEVLMQDGAPETDYMISGTLTKVRPHTDHTGREMGFLTVDTEVSVVDVTVFNSTWIKYKRDLKVGTFLAFDVDHNHRGQTLSACMPFYPSENK